MNSLGILVASCDKNKWLLNVFFEQFNRFWKDCSYNIYLCMEKENFYYSGLKIKVIKNQNELKWCGRVKNALQQMSEEYVLVLLDDFVIEEAVNTKLLNKYIQIISENHLNNIILTPVNVEGNYHESMFEELKHRKRYGRYKTSLQCGIWKKSVLEDLLREHESAWEFEIFGNIRSYLQNNEFYAVKTYEDKPIVYNDGFLVVQGRVNINEKNRLERKLGINIDIKEMPYFSEGIIRDDIKFIPRVIRRIKIIVLSGVYKLKFLTFYR